MHGVVGVLKGRLKALKKPQEQSPEAFRVKINCRELV
jgi:hypothetical protein